MRKKQFVVVGLGRFGQSLAETLYAGGEDVLAIDLNQDLVEDVRDAVTHAVTADAMDRDVLIALGVRDFDVGVVTIGSDIRASGMITMLMKELGVRQVIAKAHDEVHGRMLEKLGADKVIYPERDMGRRIAHNLVNGNIMDFIEVSPDYSMAEIQPLAEWCGKTLADLNLRERLGGINVIAVRTGEHVNAMPGANTVLKRGDTMLVMAGEDTLRKIRISR
ncbi:MAG: TrkA family potassium uptake protein [Eubacteriales bacterium]|nr:TrkA family potassium uptake protein [Eubacteriales bacterium]